MRILTRSLAQRCVHHAYLFQGPPGVGKELCAMALATSLVCEQPVDGIACLMCDACRRAQTISSSPPEVPLHPDVILLERGLYPAEAIGRARAENTELSVDQIRSLVLARAAFPPHEGRARVYIIRAADEMSIGAANALLKTLEEPGAGTHFILLTSRVERLLPTIRSRSLPVRFGPLPDPVIHRILDEAGVPEERRADAIELASGSASAAIELADAEAKEARDAFIKQVLDAAREPDLQGAVTLGESADKSREKLAQQLRGLGAYLAREARSRVGQTPHAAERAARHYDSIVEALRGLEQNASGSLTMMTLVAAMQKNRR